MFLEKTKTAAPYSRCGEPSVGASSIAIRIYGSTYQQMVERYDSVKKGDIIPCPRTGNLYQDSEVGGRYCRQWVEARQQLADVIPFNSFRRNQNKANAK